MLNLRDRNRGTAAKVPEGIYDSVVVSVDWCDSDKYGFEGAYEVTYQITSQDGKVYRHREVFKTDMGNKRTRDFENYLADNGIENLKDFEGKHEKLTFKHETKNSTVFSNIVEREFVA